MDAPPLLLVVLAGPNGAGKTTFYERFLSTLGLPFVNADIIAKEEFGAAAGEHAFPAARMADAERRRLIAQRSPFIMETVLSDSGGHKLAFFREAREAGYRVEAVFIGIESAELSAARVVGRVMHGGHHVPLDRIQARYPRTLVNLRALSGFADRLTIYDNSERDDRYRLVAVLECGIALQLATPLPVWTAGLGLQDRVTPSTNRHPL